MIPDGALETAIAVSDEVARFCLAEFRRAMSPRFEEKSPRDYISVVDQAAEDLTRQRLRTAFPDVPILGEERGGTRGPRYWCIDPIDGTTNFLSGLPIWGVSIGMIVEGEPVLGAINAPALEIAIAGQCGLTAARTGDRRNFGKLVAVGRNPSWETSERQRCEMALETAGYTVVSLGSTAVSLALVAQGDLAGYHEHRIYIWDCAAGMAICRAAGIPIRLGEVDDGLQLDVAAGFACGLDLCPVI